MTTIYPFCKPSDVNDMGLCSGGQLLKTELMILQCLVSDNSIQTGVKFPYEKEIFVIKMILSDVGERGLMMLKDHFTQNNN